MWYVFDIFGNNKGHVSFTFENKMEAFMFWREYNNENYESKGFHTLLDTENKTLSYAVNNKINGVTTILKSI